MSSPSSAPSYDAVVRRSGEVTGPIRLPMEDSQSFIKAFNQLYHGAGLSITGPLPELDAPPSSLATNVDVAADRHG